MQEVDDLDFWLSKPDAPTAAATGSPEAVDEKPREVPEKTVEDNKEVKAKGKHRKERREKKDKKGKKRKSRREEEEEAPVIEEKEEEKQEEEPEPEPEPEPEVRRESSTERQTDRQTYKK